MIENKKERLEVEFLFFSRGSRSSSEKLIIRGPMLSFPSTAFHAGLSSPRFIAPSKAPRSSCSSAIENTRTAKFSPRFRIKPTTAMASPTDNAANAANAGRAATSLDQHRSSSDDKLFAAAAERNKAPILEVLRTRLPESGLVLEVASGTGQHVSHFAEHFLRASPGLLFLPTEADESSLPSIRAHAAGMRNVLTPRVLDVARDAPESWPRGGQEEGGSRATSGPSSFSGPSSSSPPSSSSSEKKKRPYAAIYCANLTHISPFSATLGLFRGAGLLLEEPEGRRGGGGALFLYGPFAVGGRPATPSDLAFDASLRAREPSWGYRDIEAELVPAAAESGLVLEERVAMPANNWLLVFRKKRGE